MSNQPDEFLTLQSLAVELGVHYARARQLHEAQVLVPDGQTSQAFLFKRSRLPQLRAAVKDYGIDRAIKANAARQKLNPITGKNLIIK